MEVTGSFIPFTAIVKRRFVHHTSFLYDFSDKNMTYLQV